jgi:hypothetical protein
MRMLPNLIDGPKGWLAQLAFLSDVLVWIGLITDAIFEFAIPLGQHRRHDVQTVR